MKKMIVIGLILTINVLYAQNNQTNVIGPKIQFEEKSFDFGEIVEGTYATHIFYFTNVGDKPLLLKEVRPSCGCTASEWTREPVMPGEKGMIKAVFNSNGYGGREFFKSITVTFNANENNTEVIFFKGKVKVKPAEPELPQSPVRINN